MLKKMPAKEKRRSSQRKPPLAWQRGMPNTKQVLCGYFAHNTELTTYNYVSVPTPNGWARGVRYTSDDRNGEIENLHNVLDGTKFALARRTQFLDNENFEHYIDGLEKAVQALENSALHTLNQNPVHLDQTDQRAMRVQKRKAEKAKKLQKALTALDKSCAKKKAALIKKFSLKI